MITIAEYTKIQGATLKQSDAIMQGIFQQIGAALSTGREAGELVARFWDAQQSYQARLIEAAKLLPQIRKSPMIIAGVEMSYSADNRTYYFVGNGIMKGVKAAQAKQYLASLK